jgi:ectoine hydroxylase-related dioxygenase (phytanoyl-CoA dioxygenase family)
LHGQSIKTFRYDTQRYPLAELLTDMLVAKGFLRTADRAALGDLTQLHRFLPAAVTALDTAELNEISRAFYETSPAFTACYQRLIADVLTRDVVRGDCLFQRTPTIRFHFPNQEGFVWQPRFHSDVMLGHPPQEINIWLPLCRTRGASSMRIAPLEPSVEFLTSRDLDFESFARDVQVDPALQQRCQAASAPVELSYGEFIAFDPRCLHATQYNDTDLTRISLDFRVIATEDYDAIRLPYRGTGRLRMPFKRGAYYHEATALAVRA